MPATTPGGWPYVLPEDHPLEYPAESQTLANKLETLGFRSAVAAKPSDQSGIASGSGAGFTATLTGVRVGAPVMGLILHNGSTSASVSFFVTAVWTGLTPSSVIGPQISTAANFIQAIYFDIAPATATTVTLTYTGTTSSGTWQCNMRSRIYLITI